jgi:hypothetical protein
MASLDNPSGASGSASSTPQSATSAMSDMTQQGGDRVRDQASRAAGQVQEQAQAFISGQKEVAADHIEGVAKVLHDTVDQLRQKSPGAVTDYAERAVESLDSVANALRERDVRDLVGQVEDFARRQPVLFLAGTVAIGFALARFLKSSSRGGASYGQGSGSYRSNGSGYQASGGGASGLSASAPAMGSSDGPASPQYSTTRPGGGERTPSVGNPDRPSGQEAG